MPTLAYTISGKIPGADAGAHVFVREQKDRSWGHSPKVNGRLVLQSNRASRRDSRNLSISTWGPVPGKVTVVDRQFPRTESRYVSALARSYENLESEVYARIRGRLYKGSAALGVTMASWRQSRDMVTSRYRQMTLQATEFEERARRVLVSGKSRQQRRLHAIRLRGLADQYLEMVFGWQPLLADIHAAARTVIDTKPQRRWVRASASTVLSLDYGVRTSSRADWRTFFGTVRRSRGCQVTVSNPNLWLRERAGLNNPATVAWDLVPWSFVVNMFVNTGQLVGSISDFAGLTFSNPFDVKACDVTSTQHAFRTAREGAYGGDSSYYLSEKTQSLSGMTRPPVVFKVPNASWQTAAIAASLFIQKFKALEVLKLSFK